MGNAVKFVSKTFKPLKLKPLEGKAQTCKFK